MAKFATISLMTLTEARRVLGTTVIDMSDDDIRLLIKQVDILTDIVAAKATGSTIKSYIDNYDNEAHNDE